MKPSNLCKQPYLYHLAKITLTISILVFCLPQHGWATKVYSPIVEGGEWELESLNDFIRDADPGKDGAVKHQIELAYGITDWWRSGLYGVFENKAGKSLTHTQTKWENVFQLFQQGELWIDTGLYLEYIKLTAPQRPDIVEFKLLLEKPFAALIHTMNITIRACSH